MGNRAAKENRGVATVEFFKANSTLLKPALNRYRRYMTEDKYENVRTLETLKFLEKPLIFMEISIWLFTSHNYSFISFDSDFYLDMMISVCIWNFLKENPDAMKTDEGIAAWSSVYTWVCGVYKDADGLISYEKYDGTKTRQESEAWRVENSLPEEKALYRLIGHPEQEFTDMFGNIYKEM